MIFLIYLHSFKTTYIKKNGGNNMVFVVKVMEKSIFIHNIEVPYI